MAGTTVGTPEGIVTKRSVHGVDETIERLTTALTAKSVKIFAVIDHRGEAAQAGLTMPDTKVIIFGNPRAGTPIMQASPPAALDLPLRVLVASEGDETVVRYTDPLWLSSRYGFDRELAANLAVVDALTDAASRPDPEPGTEQEIPAKEQQHHD
jgi:uncharacterized protein (DUF302 family)